MDDNHQFICFTRNSSVETALENPAGVVGRLIQSGMTEGTGGLLRDTPVSLLLLSLIDGFNDTDHIEPLLTSPNTGAQRISLR